MKIIDNKGRLFGKVSLIDIFVLLAVVAILAGVYVRNFVLDTTAAGNNPDVTITYKAMIKGINNLLIDQFHVGDEFFDETFKASHGIVKEIEIKPAVTWQSTADGDYVKVYTPERSDVYLTIEATGTVKDGKHFIGRNYELEPNYELNMHSRYVNFHIYIMEIL